MNKEMQMKSQVLEMLKNFMMGEHGKRMKPAAVTVEVITPMKKGEDLDDVLDKAQKDEPVEMKEDDEDEMCEGGKVKKKSLRDFFDR